MATYLPNVTDVLPDPALYTPDFSFIDTMLRRRQALYEQGFAQVNSAYNFVNRDVLNPYSIKVRDEFLNQARQNLKNLSAMDLSQQQNVAAAKGVFDPFVKNRPVLMDMAYTAHMRQQMDIAESYRLKDGGKEFSEYNLQYLRQQMDDFSRDDISTVGTYYSNRRSFSPYYDYNKEVQDKMKDFKPSTYKFERIRGLYKMGQEDSSWREAEISEYLNGVLSDKAKQQMRIEAQVTVGRDPAALVTAYNQAAQQQLMMNKYNLEQIDKQLGSTSDPVKKNLLTRQREKIEDNNREINTIMENVGKGDMTFIKQNSEKLAFSSYFNQKLSGYVKAFAHEEKVQKIDADQAGIALMHEDRADSRQLRGFAHAEKMEAIRAANKVQGNTAKLGNFQVGELAEDDPVSLEKTISGLQLQMDAASQTAAQVTLEQKRHIFTKMKERNPNLTGRPEDLTNEQVLNWIKTGGPGGKRIDPNDEYYTYERKLAIIQSERAAIENQLEKIENGTLQGLSDADKKAVRKVNTSIQQIGTIKLDDGTTIEAKDLANGLRNGTIKVVEFGGQSSGSPIGGAPTPSSLKFTINGREIQSSYKYSPDAKKFVYSNVALSNAYNKIKDVVNSAGSAYEKFLENREKYMERNFAAVSLPSKVLSFDAGGPAAKSLEGTVGSLLPPGFDIKHAGVGVTPNNQGNTYYYITPKSDGSESPEKIADMLTARGVKVRLIKTKKGPAIFEIANLNNDIARQFRTFSTIETSVVREMQEYTGAQEYTSVPFNVPGSNTKFFIKKSGNVFYLHVNGLGPSYPQAFSSPVEAISMARLLAANNGAGVQVFLNSEQEAEEPAAPPINPDDFNFE